MLIVAGAQYGFEMKIRPWQPIAAMLGAVDGGLISLSQSATLRSSAPWPGRKDC